MRGKDGIQEDGEERSRWEGRRGEEPLGGEGDGKTGSEEERKTEDGRRKTKDGRRKTRRWDRWKIGGGEEDGKTEREDRRRRVGGEYWGRREDGTRARGRRDTSDGHVSRDFTPAFLPYSTRILASLVATVQMDPTPSNDSQERDIKIFSVPGTLNHLLYHLVTHRSQPLHIGRPKILVARFELTVKRHRSTASHSKTAGLSAASAHHSQRVPASSPLAAHHSSARPIAHRSDFKIQPSGTPTPRANPASSPPCLSPCELLSDSSPLPDLSPPQADPASRISPVPRELPPRRPPSRAPERLIYPKFPGQRKPPLSSPAWVPIPVLPCPRPA